VIAEIHKAGLLVVREGCILLCRKKRGSPLLILPGGKMENGESSQDCVVREVREELGDVSVRGLAFLASYVDVAAGDENRMVRIELYRGELVGVPAAQAEIGELVWFGEGDDRGMLSPSLRNKIVPDLIRRGVLPWHGSIS
jgi:8-oxo-dGTP diphosphatase